MKRLFNFLSRKKRVLSKPATETVVVKHHSQQATLGHNMYKADIKHDETVEANIKSVRIGRTNDTGSLTDVGQLTMFFCNLDGVEVTKRLTKGDNDPLPREVRLHGFNLPSDFKAGDYNLHNVMIHANGSINITATSKTALELVND